MTTPRRRCVVIGGGLAGLTAAHTLAANPTYDVLVLESTARAGGKLKLVEVAGITVDVGAESMLNRRPEGVALARELGLETVHPTAVRPRLWSRGVMRALPRSLMGVPQDVADLARSGVLSAAGLARVRQEVDRPPSHLSEADVSVGALVAQRMGGEVVDRLVEPLLGGVYAGRAHEISARAAVPGLVEQAERGSWLTQAAAATGTDDEPPAPVFAGIASGIGRLPVALAETGRFAMRTEAVVRAITRSGAGFLLEVAGPAGTQMLPADDLIVATPAAATARLLRAVVPVAADEMAQVESASVAVISLAVPAACVAHLDSSGFLVPPLERTGVKAATFSWSKWAWVRSAGRGTDAGADVALLRASWGRHREEWVLQRTDEELVALTLQDLERICGVAGRLIDAHVQRWGGGLPQYAVGHLTRVARVRDAVEQANASAPPGAGRIAVCGAAYDGVGIPAVIASARRAAKQVEG